MYFLNCSISESSVQSAKADVIFSATSGFVCHTKCPSSCITVGASVSFVTFIVFSLTSNAPVTVDPVCDSNAVEENTVPLLAWNMFS